MAAPTEAAAEAIVAPDVKPISLLFSSFARLDPESLRPQASRVAIGDRPGSPSIDSLHDGRGEVAAGNVLPGNWSWSPPRRDCLLGRGRSHLIRCT